MSNIERSVNSFSIEQAMEILSKNSPDSFCVEFDFLWVWCGYLNKASAKRQLDKFVEGKDFSTSLLKSNGGRQSKQFLLTPRCAKKLAIRAATEHGDRVCDFFIDAEEKLRELANGPTLTPSEILLKQCERLVAVEKQQVAMEAALVQLQAEKIEQMAIVMEAQTLAIESLKQSAANSAEIHRMSDHSGLMFSVMGYANLIKFGSLPLDQASAIGRAATKMCKAMDLPIGKTPDPRFGEVQTYPKEVLTALFANGGN